jgi:hypothetical protein
VPAVPYHHLDNIHILVIISRRVVDAFGSRFLSPSCFPSAFSCSLLLYDLSTSFLDFRAGPSIAVSRMNGPNFATFDFPLSRYLFRTLLV